MALNRFNRVECPVCHVPIGMNCSFGDDDRERFNLYHYARLLAFRATKPLKEIKERKAKQPVKQNCSSHCKNNQHSQCRGKIRLGHGISASCSCNCHKEKNV